jgi:hypothetical protein
MSGAYAKTNGEWLESEAVSMSHTLLSHFSCEAGGWEKRRTATVFRKHGAGVAGLSLVLCLRRREDKDVGRWKRGAWGWN